MKGFDAQHVAVEARLHLLAAQGWVEVVCRLVDAVDHQQFGIEPVAEDARTGVAARPREGAPAKSAVDVDRTTRRDLLSFLLVVGNQAADQAMVSTCLPTATMATCRRWPRRWWLQ